MDKKKVNSSSPKSSNSVPNYESLIQDLQSQTDLVKKYESKLHKIEEDFNYNVDLIYERDKEINNLNLRIDELISLNQEKDSEILNLQQRCSRIKQLEHDKSVLSKRVEALLAGTAQSKVSTRKFATPHKDSSQEIHGYKGIIHKKYMSADKTFSITEDLNFVPLTKLNSDLERRIQALEEETLNKRSASRQSFMEDSDEKNLSRTKEKVQIKEKEISELIKSLHPYKKEAGRGKMISYDSHLVSLNQDIERLKSEISRPSSRKQLGRDVEDRKQDPIRCTTTFDQRVKY